MKRNRNQPLFDFGDLPVKVEWHEVPLEIFLSWSDKRCHEYQASLDRRAANECDDEVDKRFFTERAEAHEKIAAS